MIRSARARDAKSSEPARDGNKNENSDYGHREMEWVAEIVQETDRRYRGVVRMGTRAGRGEKEQGGEKQISHCGPPRRDAPNLRTVVERDKTGENEATTST